MYLNDKIDIIAGKLSADKRFDNIKVVMAYPNVHKSTQLKKIVAAVSPSEIDAEKISVGDNCMYGEYKIDIDVFVPHNFGSPCIQNTVESVVDVLKDEMPSGIKVSKIQVNNSLFCYYVNCCFTFCDVIDFGGSENE